MYEVMIAEDTEKYLRQAYLKKEFSEWEDAEVFIKLMLQAGMTVVVESWCEEV